MAHAFRTFARYHEWAGHSFPRAAMGVRGGWLHIVR